MPALELPRNTTRQAEGLIYGEAARMLHRITGAVIVIFVLVHVIAQAVLHVPAFSAMKSAAPWLPVAQSQHWIHAILYSSIVFHTLYGLKLLAMEVGARLDCRASFWAIVALSAAFGLREILRYAGI